MRRISAALASAIVLLAAPAAQADPDLIVQDITLSPSSPSAGGGSLDCVFKNIGPHDVELPVWEFTNYTVQLDGSECDSGTIFDLNAGSTNNESISSSCIPGTGGNHSIRVFIDSDDDVNESNESNNTRTETFTWQSGGPDLIVESIKVSPTDAAAGSGDIDVVFKNIGSGDVDLPFTEYTNYQAYRGSTPCADGTIFDLNSGSTNNEGIDACIPDVPGTYTIRVVIDSDGDVIETNENNNELQITHTWAGADLRVKSIASADTPPYAGGGTLTTVFENIGAADVDLGFTEYTNYEAYRDGTLCESGTIFDLNAGATNSENISDCIPDAPGTYSFRVVIDSDGDVGETNESNNERTESITFSGPDLIVASITADSATPAAGQASLAVVFQNIGPVDVDLPFSEYTNYVAYRDGVECESGTIFDLNAGATNEDNISDCVPDIPGTYSFRVVIDSDGDVGEVDETNNETTVMITFTGPDLVVQSIVADTDPPQAGNGSLTVTFFNPSSVDVDLPFSEYTNYVAYRDDVECESGTIFDLGAGDTNEDNISDCIPDDPGTYTFRVVIDSDDDVAEIDETNNELTVTLTYDGPDLIVASITPDDPPAAGGGDLEVVFQNIGSVDVDLGLTNFTNYVAYRDDVECDDGFISDLDAGDTNAEGIDACIPNLPGTYVFRVEIDSDGDVGETDETNNVLEKTITFGGPDLVVKSLTVDPAAPTLGQGSLEVIFENVGAADVDLGLTEFTNYTVTRNGSPCDDGFITDLAAGDTNTESVNACVPSAAGTYEFVVTIDSDSDVGETDETNNTLTMSITWAGDPCAGPELCDGLDNDCDSMTDEGFSDLGNACTTPDGCPSTFTCSPAGDAVQCAPDSAAAEACNGKDDNCNGATDEGFGVGDACTATGACSGPGAQQCNASGDGTTCVATGGDGGDDSLETCNGADDDCDGAVDEPFPTLGGPCQVGTGFCETWGTIVCGGAGEGATCDAMTPPADAEQCGNGIDDDCDGVTDEGCACGAGTFIDCGGNAGACDAGEQLCDGGVLGDVCTGAIGPIDEVCDNGVDDDCDGSVDEGCSCTAAATRGCAPDAGACTAAGMQTCTAAGYWGLCEGAGVYAVETCGDGVDNDCDGQADENCGCRAQGAGCAPGQSCQMDGSCIACAADCAGKQCGDDGCGGTCGSCAAGTTCDSAGQCMSQVVEVAPDVIGGDIGGPGPKTVTGDGGGCAGGPLPALGGLWALLVAVLLGVRRRQRSR